MALARPDSGIVDAVAWIHIVDHRVLVVRTAGRDAWYIPGGKPDAGEADVDAIVREVREELGVDLDPTSVEHWWTSEAPAHAYEADTMVKMRCYTATGAGDPAPSAEIEELGWFGSDDIPRCAPAAQAVLTRLAAADRIR